MKKTFLLLPGLLMLLAGCANNFKYFGNSYPPTQYAKIYFRESDIDKPYEIMGTLYATFDTNTKDEKVQRKIMDKVRQHGGDGALFGEMFTKKTGAVAATTGGSTKAGKKGRAGGSVSKVKDTEQDQLEIKVIKYKTNQ